MTEKTLSAIEAIMNAANHKATNMFIATGLVVTGQTAQEARNPEFKSLADIPISEIFQHDLSAASTISLIGGCWITLQILNFCGFFRFVKGLWDKLRAKV